MGPKPDPQDDFGYDPIPLKVTHEIEVMYEKLPPRPKKDRPFLKRIGTFVRNLFQATANTAIIVKYGPASLAAILGMLAAAYAAWRMMR